MAASTKLTTDGMNFTPSVCRDLDALLSDSGLIESAHHAFSEADNENMH